jgi:phosphoglycolate phosphatase
MTIGAVLFDLDGTLVDSLGDLGSSMNIVLEKLGCPTHSLSSYRTFVGDGVEMLARRALPADRRDPATISAAVATMREVYGARFLEHTRPYPGIPELLDSLHARAFRLAVLSNKPHDLTVALVSALFGRWPLAPVFGERAGVPRKPDPAAALEVAHLLGLQCPRVLYLGDTPTDMATARAAGMPAVGVSWGFRDAGELRAAGADAVVHSPSEVLALLG